METIQNNIYFSRTETEETVVIVWKPYATYGVYVFLVAGAISAFLSMIVPAMIAMGLFFGNSIVYMLFAREIRKEVNEATRKACVQLSGNKFSFSSPLTVTIRKERSL